MANPAKSTVTGLKVLNDVQVNGNITVAGTHTQTGAQTFGSTVSVAGAATLSSTLAVTGAVTLASTLAVTGAATFASTVGITGALSLTVPLTKVNLSGAAKRIAFAFPVNAGGTLADGTTYRGQIPTTRAGQVTAVGILAATPPVGGTNTVNVKKGGASGQSVLAAAFDPVSLVANVVSSATLNATPANRAYTATEGLYWEWVAGTQSTDAVNAAVLVEVELDDF